jgi:hypothetical protein
MQLSFTEVPFPKEILLEKHPKQTDKPVKKPKNWLIWLIALALLIGGGLAYPLFTADPVSVSEPEPDETPAKDSLFSIRDRIRRCKALPDDGRRLDSLLRFLFPEQFIHPNDHEYIGPQCVYAIFIDGILHKYGKASMNDLDQNGTPNRINRQKNDLKKQYPKSTIYHNILFQHEKISTADIEKKETKYIQDYVNGQPKHLCPESRLPEGNQGHRYKIDFNQ